MKKKIWFSIIIVLVFLTCFHINANATIYEYEGICHDTYREVRLGTSSRLPYPGRDYADENVYISVKYKSSNRKIATVDTNGVVTGRKKGTAKITMICKYYSVGEPETFSFKIVYKIKVISNLSVAQGEKIKLVTGKRCSSSNTDVATISKNGILKAKKKGKTTIKIKKGGYTYTYQITVKESVLDYDCDGIPDDKDIFQDIEWDDVKDPVISKTSVTLHLDDSVTLDVYDAYDSVYWNSNNKNVVEVSDSGELIPNKPGTAVVTATVYKYTLKCYVTVVE